MIERSVREPDASSPSLGADGGWNRDSARPGPGLSAGSSIALVCVMIVAAALIAAFALAGLQDKVYGARADILYLAGPDVPLDVRERVLATQAELLRTRALLGPIAGTAGMRVEDLQDAVSAEVGLNDFLRLTVRDEDPAVAQRLAQDVALRYVQFTASLENPPNVRLLSPAYPLNEPLSPTPTRSVALGLLVGLNLAIAAAVLLTRQRRREKPHGGTSSELADEQLA